MRAMTLVLTALLLIIIGMVICSGLSKKSANEDVLPGTPGDGQVLDEGPKPLFLALIPERDIFAQRQRYQALAGEIARHMNRPVELVSLSTYQSVLLEMKEKRIDGAFVGSLLAVQAHDQLDARILAKPQSLAGGTTYTGVIIVAKNSPIQNVSELAGKSIAMVRTTTAGCLFPTYLFYQNKMLDDETRKPQMRWVGTHDQVIREVLAGTVDAGAVKNLRLEAFLTDNPKAQIRQLAVSAEVPDNGLIVRGDIPADQVQKLKATLLDMDKDVQGQQALAVFGIQRFLPCDIDEYHAVYEMIKAIGPHYQPLGVLGQTQAVEAGTVDQATIGK